jgi:hypothetical protein
MYFVLFYVFLCCSMHCLFCVVLCIVSVYMCTELLPPGGYPIAVKYIVSYHYKQFHGHNLSDGQTLQYVGQHICPDIFQWQFLWIHGAKSSLKTVCSSARSRYYLHFMKTEGALVTSTYLEPDQSSPCLSIPLMEDQFNIILPSMPRSSK